MDFVIDFKTLVLLTSWLAVAVALASFLLIAGIGIARVSRMRQHLRSKRFIERWARIFANPSAQVELPGISKALRFDWMSLWNSAFAAGGDSARKHLRAIASASNMTACASQTMRSRDAAESLEAIVFAGNAVVHEAAEQLRALCISSDPVASIAAYHALLQIEPSNAGRFVDAMVQRADWPPGALIEIVTEENTRIGGALVRACGIAASSDAERLIPYLQYVRSPEVLSYVRGVLRTSDDPGVMRAALKVIGEIGASRDEALVWRHASNPDWRIRVRVARALGRLGTTQATVVLKQLLCDTNWWVRYRASEALATIAGRSSFDARLLLPEIEDPFGHEALAHAIAEYAYSAEARS